MAANRPVTLKEISHQLGLGMSTVSEVLNNKPIRCKPSTRKRILDLAHELNYRPNIVAQSLTSQKTKTIALVTTSLFMELDEIEQICWGGGYTMNVTATHLNHDKQRGILAQLRQRHVDGAMLIEPLPDCEMIAELGREKYPLVVVDNELSYPQLDMFMPDIKGGVKAATKHLIALGHRRIAATFARSPYAFSTLRKEGWREGISEELGIEPPEQWLVALKPDYHSDEVYSMAYEAAGEFMRRFGKDDTGRPTAVFCSADEVAVGMIHGFYDAGWRVPEDISVIGMMALEAGRYCRPPVTSVDIEHRKCRKEAIKRLFRLVMDGQVGSEPVQTKFGVHLVERASTARPPF